MSAIIERDEAPSNPFADEHESNALVEIESSRAVAEIQAQYVVARKFPRDPMRAMDMILRDCTLPKLAEAATYEYTRGKESISAPTIRLAEAIGRRWGNLKCGVVEISRHEGYSFCKAFAEDLETGFSDERTFQVRHWRDTQRGGYELTDERDIYELIANMGARRKRACMLSVIPMDVVEQAVRACEVTLKSKVVVDDESLKILLEVFAKYNVTREMIEQRIQRRYDKSTVTPGMVMQLKRIYNSLEDGMSKPEDWFKGAAPSAEERQDNTRTAKGRKRPQSTKASAEPPKPPAQSPQGNDVAGKGGSADAPPQPADPTKLASPEELAFIRQKAQSATITEAEICKAFRLQKLEELRAAAVGGVIKWLGDPSSQPLTF